LSLCLLLSLYLEPGTFTLPSAGGLVALVETEEEDDEVPLIVRR